MEGITGVHRKLHDGLRYFYSSPDIGRMTMSKWMRWASHLPTMRDNRNVNTVFEGNPVARRLLRRPAHRWEVKCERILEK
jgi:hypothetical protein